jgi:hypothetical protein
MIQIIGYIIVISVWIAIIITVILYLIKVCKVWIDHNFDKIPMREAWNNETNRKRIEKAINKVL